MSAEREEKAGKQRTSDGTYYIHTWTHVTTEADLPGIRAQTGILSMFHPPSFSRRGPTNHKQTEACLHGDHAPGGRARSALDVFERTEASAIEHGLRALDCEQILAILRLQSWLGPVSLTGGCMLLLQACNGKLGLDRNQASLWTPGYAPLPRRRMCRRLCLIPWG